ncbi:hypothetical protein C7212DRAFT_333975, partial [Tuber magnatum]
LIQPTTTKPTNKITQSHHITPSPLFQTITMPELTGDVQLCLACQSVYVKKPNELCASCELSPHILPSGHGSERGKKG